MKAYNIEELANIITELANESRQEDDFVFLVAKIGEKSAMVMNGGRQPVVTGLALAMTLEGQFARACTEALTIHTIHKLTSNEE